MSTQPAAAEVRVRVTGLSKSFQRRGGRTVRAVDDVSFTVAGGEFLVLLGPSGCGKTTLLRLLAGLETPDQGRIELDGATVFDYAQGIHEPPERRRLGMVFQSYALWPNMTASENIAYPLKMQGERPESIAERVAHMLAAMQIEEVAEQFPGQMSGGQQQRVALARALIRGHRIVLFDEPLSNVDAKVRQHLRDELLSLQRQIGFTSIYVTHDQDESMALASHIAVLKSGTIAQIDSPRTIYQKPASRYVASFVGSTNALTGSLAERNGRWVVVTDIGELEVPAHIQNRAENKVIVITRPENWTLSVGAAGQGLEFETTIESAVFMGAYNEYRVGCGASVIAVRTSGKDVFDPGERTWCSISPSDLTMFPSD